MMQGERAAKLEPERHGEGESEIARHEERSAEKHAFARALTHIYTHHDRR